MYLEHIRVKVRRPPSLLEMFTFIFQTWLICVVYLQVKTVNGEELWRSDVTNRMNVGVTASGFTQVKLDCGRTGLIAVVETKDEFRGVIYTRGSFYSRKDPCFVEANGGRRFRLDIPYDQCNVQDEGDIYLVTLIMQHDKELIMPGDGAFALQCDLTAKDSQTMKMTAMSSISLADPDPAGKDVPTHLRSTVSSPNVVVFRPADIRQKDAKPGAPSMKRVEL